MSIVNETALLWLSSKEENNDRNCVTLESLGMAFLILELFHQKVFPFSESYVLASERAQSSISLKLRYPITTSLSF